MGVAWRGVAWRGVAWHAFEERSIRSQMEETHALVDEVKQRHLETVLPKPGGTVLILERSRANALMYRRARVGGVRAQRE